MSAFHSAVEQCAVRRRVGHSIRSTIDPYKTIIYHSATISRKSVVVVGRSSSDSFPLFHGFRYTGSRDPACNVLPHVCACVMPIYALRVDSNRRRSDGQTISSNKSKIVCMSINIFIHLVMVYKKEETKKKQ